MHRVLLLLLLVGLAAASPLSDKNDDNATGRLLTGKVLDNHDNPLPGAVVHLTNIHSRAVKTFFTRRDGTYRFPGLSFNVDYEVYAQFKGEVSETETLNKSDDDRRVNISSCGLTSNRPSSLSRTNADLVEATWSAVN